MTDVMGWSKRGMGAMLLCLAMVAGCAKQTTVVLLPDPDGKVGKVIVGTETGKVEMTRTREGTKVKGAKHPAAPVIVSEQEIERDYGTVLDSLPEPPEHFILYFSIESIELTLQSKKVVPEIFASVKAKESQSIAVVGHTDTAGDATYNLNLSNRRAKAVKQLLLNGGVAADSITVTSHGENNPLVLTADNVPERRNRRVEVVVR